MRDRQGGKDKIETGREAERERERERERVEYGTALRVLTIFFYSYSCCMHHTSFLSRR